MAATTLVGGAICLFVVFPLLAPILWAMVFATVAHPLYLRLARRLGHRALAAALVVGLVALVVAVPFAFVAVQLVQEMAGVAAMVKSGEAARLWQEALARQPLLAALVEWLGRHVDLPTVAGQGTGALTRVLQAVLSGSLAGGVGWLVMSFILFFFLRDSALVLAAVERYLPLSRVEVDELYHVVADTIHATVWGTIAVALVQGTLGALAFWWLELPAPVVWGSVMALLSVLPMLGAAIVWLPVALWFALQGQWQDALALTAFGAVVIGLIDNLIYPLIVKDRIRLHAVPVFVSIIGGLIVLGASGVVLGPLLLAITDALVRIWRRRLGLRDEAAAPATAAR
ncbi:MAG TPA: AI-2E family transporter [Albitalea sp.]